MELSFNMDYILRNSFQRHSDLLEDISEDIKQSLSSNKIVFTDKEESMLPDSSLSPSNQNLNSCIMDESKDVFDGATLSPSKECSTTTTMVVYGVSGPVSQTGGTADQEPIMEDRRGRILETLLYATRMALVEVQLHDLEIELATIDDHFFSAFINRASNLKSIAGQVFLPHVVDSCSSRNTLIIDPEVNVRDEARRLRLSHIIRKHSELKRWLAKIKRTLKHKHSVRHRCSKEVSSNALECDHKTTNICQDRVVNSNVNTARPSMPEKSHSDILSDLIASNHCHQITQQYEGITMDSPEAWTSETMPDRSRFYEKNIFSTILSMSKDGADREEIPLLPYEPETRSTARSTSVVPGTAYSDHGANQRPPTPDLRKPDLDYTDVAEGIRVLVVQRDHLRAGVIQLAREGVEGGEHKLWRVALDGARRGQDMIMSEWQLLEQGVREVIPTSINQLGPGSRLCANWSVQLPMNLYPGTVSTLAIDHPHNLDQLPVQFDDGDHKDVDLHQIRVLPDNFPNLHELMKAPHIADSNIYSLDRTNRANKQGRSTRLQSNQGNEVEEEGGGRDMAARPMKRVEKRKKVVVHWTLMKSMDGADVQYRLVRNIDDVCVRAGDSVQLLSYSRHNYMALVVSVLARRQSAIMDLKCHWYYILADVQDHSHVIRRLKKSAISKMVLFKTSHADVNDVYSVLRKVEVLPFEEYKVKYLGQDGIGDIPEHSYVMAGIYDQRRSRVVCLDEDIRKYVMSREAD